MDWLCSRCHKRYAKEILNIRRNPVFDEIFEAILGSEEETVPIVEFDIKEQAFNLRTDLYKYRATLARVGDPTYRDSTILSLVRTETGWRVVGKRRDRYPRKGRWLVDVEAEILALEDRLDSDEEER